MISAVILTKNNEETIKKTLCSLVGFDEVLIVDSGSTDQTLSIIKNFPNTRIVKKEFTGFGSARNFGAMEAKNDWILAIDSDEVLMGTLPDVLDPLFAYSFPFHNYFNGKWIRSCGWYPDRHVRLYNKKHASFSEDLLHEKLLATHVKALSVPINHYSYRSIEDFSRKMHLYSNLFADQNMGKKRSSVLKAILHGLWAFFKSYIIKRGFLDGKEGWIISAYNGHTSYYKYLKLHFRNG